MTGKWQIDFPVINPRDKASSYSLFPFLLSRKEQKAFHQRVSISSRHFYPLTQSYMCGVRQGCLQWCFSQKIELEQEIWSSQAVSSAICWKVRRNLWKKAQQIQTGPLEVSAAPLAPAAILWTHGLGWVHGLCWAPEWCNGLALWRQAAYSWAHTQG